MKKTEVKRRSKRLPLLNIPKGHENSDIRWLYKKKKYRVGDESGQLFEICRMGKSSIVGEKSKQHDVLSVMLTEFRGKFPMMSTRWVILSPPEKLINRLDGKILLQG